MKMNGVMDLNLMFYFLTQVETSESKRLRNALIQNMYARSKFYSIFFAAG